MLSKRFFLQIIIRIVLLIATSLGLAWAFIQAPIYLTCCILVFLLYQSVALVRHINRSNEKIAFFFESVKNEDFTLKFSEAVADKSFRELHHRVNELNTVLRSAFINNRKQESYFKEVLAQINTGILSYNSKGHILFANPHLQNLLNFEQFNHIRQLEHIHQPLYELIQANQLKHTNSIKITNERGSKELSLNNSVFQV